MADLPIIEQLLTFWHSGASSGGGEGGIRPGRHFPWGRHFKEGKQIFGLHTVI